MRSDQTSAVLLSFVQCLCEEDDTKHRLNKACVKGFLTDARFDDVWYTIVLGKHCAICGQRTRQLYSNKQICTIRQGHNNLAMMHAHAWGAVSSSNASTDGQHT